MIPPSTQDPLADQSLLADGALVESELLTLEDVAVDTAALAGARGDNGEETTGLELLLDGALDLAGGLDAGLLLLLDRLALLDLLGLGALLLATAADGLAVVGLVPLAERSGIDLDNGGLGEGVGADQLVVGRVVGDGDDAGLAGDTLRAPGEVARVETEGTELAVAATGADEVDTLGTDTGVGSLAALLESCCRRTSELTARQAIGLRCWSDTNLIIYVPRFLLAGMLRRTSANVFPMRIRGDSLYLPLGARGGALPVSTARDTHFCG